MALKKGWPAIRAEWLWKWQERGTVGLMPLLGTKVLIVVRNTQPFKTWHEQKNGNITKHTNRYWLGEGILLVPRWDPLELHYNPLSDKGLERLDREELRERGMYRLEDGTLLVLIYQHVEGALHFQRQQWHIRLESYAKELKEISEVLVKIEEKALENISLPDVQGVVSGNLVVLEIVHKRRRQEINQILTRLADRERAAEILINALQRELQFSQKGIEGIFVSKPLEDLLARRPVSVEGLSAYLVRSYKGLQEIKIRPIVKPINQAQFNIRMALGALALSALDVKEVNRFHRQLELAISNLQKAEELLKHPSEKIEKLQLAAA